MESHKTSFNDVLEVVNRMSLDEQSLIIEILENRYRERRREDILRNARKTLQEYKKGLTKKGTVADLIKDLEDD
jgi:uncharacterized protein YeeX (DUF496 family)